MGGRHRNEPCWCGSGKKHKKCHRNRERQQPASPWEAQARFRKTFSTKTCLHPDSGPNTCGGGIIRAHTVRRSADLKAIAHQGHVFQCSVDFASLNKTGGRLIPRPVGIKEASTFWGFCHRHDSSTFAPLETQTFGPTAEQAFLLAYRPLVKELYLKTCQLESLIRGRDADKGRSIVDQIFMQGFIQDMSTGVESAIYDLKHHKTIFDADLRAGDFRHIRYAVIHLDRAPEIMCSGTTQPVHSFTGMPIQDLSAIETILQQVAFSLLATETGGAAVFAWHA